MKASTRWQDYAAVIIGAYAALSPLWLDTNNAAVWSLIVLGVLIAVAGLLHMLDRRWSRRTTRWACSACCCSSPRG